MVDIELRKRGVYLGKTGETGRYRVWLDVSAWDEEYEGGVGLLLYTDPKGNTAPMRTVTEFDGVKTKLYGYVTAEETKEAGTGVIEARWESAGVVAKSDHFNTVVMASSYTGKDIGENTPDWVSELMTELNAADVLLKQAAHVAEDVAEICETIEEAETVARAAALDSEAWAVGKRNGEDVDEDDPAYGNNAKKYAQDAGGSAAAAGVFKQEAEAWAKGTKNGQDVPSTDPAYQNNAKYWSDHAFSATPEGYEDLVSAFEEAEDDIADLKSATGDLSGLSTDNKSSLVSAVNEINGHFLDGIAEGVADWMDEHPDAADTPTPLLAKNIMRVGCIGDSYINGSYAADGTQIAWPYFMEKMTGHTWMNFGCAGSGAKTWIEGPSDLTRLSEVQNEEKKCQAYIIGLGLNDCKPGLTTYVPVGTASDIGTTVNSYYAYYYRLVQAVHAVNDRAPIFCLTCPYPDSIHLPYNAAVRDIVEYCRNAQQPVFLCDLAGDAYNNSRFFKNPIFTLDLQSGHYSTLGQEMMAECLLRVISDVMMTNISAFRGIMSVPFSLDTIGGFKVLANGAKFGGRDGAIDNVIEDSGYCIVGWFDSGTTGSKSYTLFSPDSTGGIIRFFNDKNASSVDFWSFSANATRTVTASGRYIAFHVKKSLAGNYYVYDNTNNKFIAKGNLVT